MRFKVGTCQGRLILAWRRMLGTAALAAVVLASEAVAQTEASKEPELVAVETPVATLSPDLIQQVAAALPRLFEFHGYVRSAFGGNGKGGDQEAFLIPGTGNMAGGPPVKYRLGNETETYGELILVSNWLGQRGASAWVKSQVMLVFLTGGNDNFDVNDLFVLREAFVQAGNVIAAVPELSFWAGQRYYRRWGLHLNDFWILDMSGYGGGFEDLPVGIGKLALAYLGGSSDGDLIGKGRPAKHTLDLRLSAVPVPLGRLTLWLAGSLAPGGRIRKLDDMPVDDGSRFPDTFGWGAGLSHESDAFLGGHNKLTLQAGGGALTDFWSSYRPLSKTLTAEVPGSQLVVESWRLRATETIELHPIPELSLVASMVAQLTETGAVGPSQSLWLSAGARPIWHITETVSLAFEAGIDYIDDRLNRRAGYLAKYTLAAQIAPERLFFSRPILRAYVTAAHWSQDFRGLIGGDAYAKATQGLGFGVQMETWW